MNPSKETAGADSTEPNKQESAAIEPVEIELDSGQLLALDPAVPGKPPALPVRDLSETATNLELSQSLDDLRSLTWPGTR